METAQARRNDSQGYGFQPLAPRYIPFPTPPIQQVMIAQKKAGVASVQAIAPMSKHSHTTQLKHQKPMYKRSF
jgi:hypothetical protein